MSRRISAVSRKEELRTMYYYEDCVSCPVCQRVTRIDEPRGKNNHSYVIDCSRAECNAKLKIVYKSNTSIAKEDSNNILQISDEQPSLGQGTTVAVQRNIPSKRPSSDLSTPSNPVLDAAMVSAKVSDHTNSTADVGTRSSFEVNIHQVASYKLQTAIVVGYWIRTDDGDLETQRFGLQLSAPTLPNGVYGGYTYLGQYQADLREGFGEICYAFTHCERRWTAEEGGRVVGFWTGNILQGPAWKVYPSDSRHYRGRSRRSGISCSLVWFKRKPNGTDEVDPDYEGELMEEIFLDVEPGGNIGSWANGRISKSGSNHNTWSNSTSKPHPSLVQMQMIHDRVVEDCDKLHHLKIPNCDAIPGAERTFLEIAGRLSQAMVELLNVPGILEERATFIRRLWSFLIDGSDRHTPFFGGVKAEVERLAQRLNLVQTHTRQLKSTSRTRGTVTRHMLTT